MIKQNLNLNLSLFSGAGGLDIGLQQAGFKTLKYVEFDKTCRETLKLNIANLNPNYSAYNEAHKNLFNDVKDYTEESTVRYELVSGGPPCQSFSTAGKRKALEDPRGNLILEFIRIIRETQPRFFIMENVRGLTSAKVSNGLAGSVLQEEILPKFLDMEYELSIGLVNALDYGIPQDRKRFFIIGSRNHEFNTWPEYLPIEQLIPPTHGPTTDIPYLVLKDAIFNLQECGKGEPEYTPYAKHRANIYDRVPPGKNWRFFVNSPQYATEFVQYLMGGAYESSGGRVGFWRRLSWDKWSPTLTTSPLQKATGLCHPDEARPLSVQEYARIQGFPDTWAFAGNTRLKYRQIGNAVPIKLGEVIGKALINM